MPTLIPAQRVAMRYLAKEVAPNITLRGLVLLGAALLSLFIDQSYAGAFSAIQANVGGSLSSTADEFSWTTVYYGACYETMILLTPWLVRRFGRRLVFSSGHVTFFVVTVYLAISTSLDAFIACRALQGLAQGTFWVASTLIILRVFPPRYLGYSFSLFSIFSLAGAASGPFIGGWFFDHGSPSGALAFYALLAFVAAALVYLLLDPQQEDITQRLDVPAVVSLFVGFFGLQFVVAYGERKDWFANSPVAFFVMLGCGAFAVFIFRELTTSNPLTPLRLYHVRNLAIGSILGFGMGAPLFGANGFLVYAEQELGFPPSTTGALLLLRILAVIVVAPTIVMLVNADAISVRVPVIVGFLLISGSYELLSWNTTTDSSFDTFVFAIIISGIGFSCSFSPIANVIVRSLPADSLGDGAAIFKTVIVLGGAFGTTLLNVLFDHDFAGFSSLLTENTNAAQLGIAHDAASLVQLTNLVSAQASTLAYEKNFQWVAVVGLTVLPIAFFLTRPSRR
jgi:DHA2 family multidrug resistance protein